MKEINLREFYPEIYKTDLFISLPDEVVDVLVEYQRKEVAYRRRTYRHKVIMGMILNAKLFFLPQRCRRS